MSKLTLIEQQVKVLFSCHSRKHERVTIFFKKKKKKNQVSDSLMGELE